MSNPEDIMEETGKTNKIILTNDDVFLNTDCIFIEYHDVIKSPYFTLLLYLADPNIIAFDDIFELSEIKGLDVEALYEWYLNREHQFLLDNFKLKENMHFPVNDPDGKKWKYDFVHSLFENVPDIVFRDTALNFVTTLAILLKKDIVKKCYIYIEDESNTIESELESAFPNHDIMYVHGNLEEVLKKEQIPANSTFVFSDVRKIMDVKKAGILNLSSVIIADRYGYNYKKGTEDLVIPIDLIFKENIFKLDFFDNINS